MRTLLALAAILLVLAAPATASAFGLGSADCGPLKVPLLLDFLPFKLVGCPVAYVGAAAGTVAALPVAAIVAPMPGAGSGGAVERFRSTTRTGREIGMIYTVLPVELALGGVLDALFSP